MRRIDETIKFMGYEKGDRLGHALAIGLDPIEWLQHKSEILIPIHELFDNFVWLWKMSIEMTPLYPAANLWTDHYAHEALSLGQKLYPAENTNANLADYYKAWLLRRNNPIYIEKNIKEIMAEYVPDFIGEKPSRLDSAAGKVYSTYLHDKELPGREKEVLVLRHDQFFKHHSNDTLNQQSYVITDKEAGFWNAVQDYILQQCSSKGIIIEANPSSNVYISELDRYYKHPVFRWHPIKECDLESGRKYNRFGLRKGPVEVCINTDDPTIFSTTLQNEFKLLRQSAINQFKHGSEEVEDWLEKLRLKGVKIFNENYICPYEQI